MSPSQGQLFHSFAWSSLKGHSNGSIRRLEVYCTCGWEFSEDVRRTYQRAKKLIDIYYKSHVDSYYFPGLFGVTARVDE